MRATTPTDYRRAGFKAGGQLIDKFVWFSAALLCFAVSPASAQSTEPYPAGFVDARTIRVQEKVEQLFEQREFERALFIYEHELAPLGDKYAQYMVGYMYLTGTGVAEDPVRASAWYRLAAERRNPEFMAVRDQLLSSLTDVELGRSDQLYLQLRQKYSDVVIMVRLIREDLESLSARTGSRVLGGGGQVMIVDPRSGFGISGEDYERQLRNRIETNLEFVNRELGIGAARKDLSSVNVDDLEARVKQIVARIDDR